jgi:hypothetical protein
LPATPAATDGEYQRYRAAMVTAYTEYDGSPHAGPPPGWEADAAAERIRAASAEIAEQLRAEKKARWREVDQ